MTVARVGPATYTLSAAGTVTPTYSQAPTAGNLLVMGVRAVAGSYPVLSTPAGWTAGPTGQVVGAGDGNYNTIGLFWKVATGGDANPSFTASPNWNAGVLVEEFSGLAASVPLDAVSTVGFNTQNTWATAGTCNSGLVTTTNADDWLWTYTGAYVSGTARVLTWGGGSTIDASANDTPTNRVQLGTATQTLAATGTYTPTLSFSAGSDGSWFCSATATMAFKQVAVAPSGFTGWGIFI